MPYTTVVAATTITAAWANASVRDQVVTPFTTTTARDSAITAPVEGMVAAITDDDILTVYSGSAWVEIARYGSTASWTPALTGSAGNPTLGSGSTQSGLYRRSGRIIDFATAFIAFGSSGTAVGSGDYRFSLPVTASAAMVGQPIGTIYLNNSGTVTMSLLVCAATTYAESYLTAIGSGDGLGASDFFRYTLYPYEAAS
jgi:hypothetical protein